jgi:hypothetical protein
VDVVEGALVDGPNAVSLSHRPVVLLNDNRVSVHRRDPGDMPIRPSIGLSDSTRFGGAVDRDAGSSGSVIPGVRVAPGGALVSVGKMDTETLVDALCDERGALALVVVPLVDAAAGVVNVVVFAGSGNLARRLRARALAGHEAVLAGLDIVVGHIAAVRGLVPDVVAVDVVAVGLAGELDVGGPGVGFDDRAGSRGLRTAVERVGVGQGIRCGRDQSYGGGQKRERSDDGKLHCVWKTKSEGNWRRKSESRCYELGRCSGCVLMMMLWVEL